MNTAIHGREALLAINPDYVAAYLQGKHWESAEKIGNIGTFWKRTIGDEALEILLPAHRRIGDFTLRLSEALQTLEVAEKRSQFEIYSEILLADKDLIRVTTRSADRTSLLRLSGGAALLSAAKDMMVSASCSVISPQPVYTARRPAKAQTYVDSLEVRRRVDLNHRDFGILSNARLPQAFARANIEIFDRKVVRKLETAFGATNDLLNKQPPLNSEDIAQLVQEGLSANYFDAVSDILMSSPDSAEAEISIEFAPIHPIERKPSLHLYPNSQHLLAQWAARFRQEFQGDSESLAVTGSITALRRRVFSKKGSITVELDFEFEGLTNMRVELENDDYELAVKAHAAKNKVSITGVRIRRGNWVVLQNPKDFKIIGT